MLPAKKIGAGRGAALSGALLFLSLYAIAGPLGRAAADPIETDVAVGVSPCTSTGQLCDPPFSYETDTGSVLQVQHVVAPFSCSSVRLHIFVDGAPKTTTDFLGWPSAPPPFDTLPLDTGILDLGPVSPGRHLLSVQAEGQESGCNAGFLESWAGSLHISTTTPPAGVGGTVTGMSLSKANVTCRNLTTKKIVKITIPAAARSWNCETAGLVVNPGDKIRMTLTGKGPAD